MNIFVPMSKDKITGKNFLNDLAKHFEMHYRNTDDIIEKLREISGKMEKNVTKKSEKMPKRIN